MMIRLGNFLFHYRNGLFPLVYLLLAPRSAPLMNDWRIAAVLGFIIALSGQIIRAVTIGLDYIIRGGRNRQVYAERLVQGGIFAHCRNPLYVGNFTILLGVAVASNSVLFAVVGIPFFLVAYRAIIAAEENFLRGKFGGEFDEYCGRVNRLLPNLRGLGSTLKGMRFNWRRLITAEYGSTFIWLAAILLVSMKNAWLAGDRLPDSLLQRSLIAGLAAVTLAYCVARYAKKSGLLAARKDA